jgi:hypothetical protein
MHPSHAQPPIPIPIPTARESDSSNRTSTELASQSATTRPRQTRRQKRLPLHPPACIHSVFPPHRPHSPLIHPRCTRPSQTRILDLPKRHRAIEHPRASNRPHRPTLPKLPTSAPARCCAAGVHANQCNAMHSLATIASSAQDCIPSALIVPDSHTTSTLPLWPRSVQSNQTRTTDIPIIDVLTLGTPVHIGLIWTVLACRNSQPQRTRGIQIQRQAIGDMDSSIIHQAVVGA